MPDRRLRRVKLGRIGRARPTGGLRAWCTELATPHDRDAAREEATEQWGAMPFPDSAAAVVLLASEHLPCISRRPSYAYLIRQLTRATA